jgi:aspartyl-tRNA(Asn)/glutamyl-tRNA(Gln) amidotransferase subunit A
MSQELHYLSIADAARLVASRELSPVDLTQAYLRRIEEVDGQLSSFITVTEEMAMAQARTAESEIAKGEYRGPLHGIAFGLKDNIETSGVLTTAHSKVLARNVPGADASVVARLYRAGAVLLGKQALHEFAHGGPSFDLPWPPARNPWNSAHFTGSSSSGSGAAVAAGLGAFALGTDTGGSLRSPAWLCGVVGFKPTFGLVGRGGVVPFSASCDHVGPLARTVEDAALVMQAIAGYDARDPGSVRSQENVHYSAYLGRSLRGIRIGVLRRHFEQDTQPNEELLRAFEASLSVMRELGATVEDVSVRPLHDYYSVRIVLTESEMFARHQHNLREHASDYGSHFLGRTLAASLFTSADYLAAQRQRRLLIEEMQPLYERYDAFVTPGAGPAPHLNSHRSLGTAQKWLRPSIASMFSVTGAPALALPCGFSRSGLPLGLQIAGRPFEDAKTLAIGHAYERASSWFERHPRLDAHAPPAPIDTSESHDEGASVDPAIRAEVSAAVRRAALNLDSKSLALLMESAPHAIAMATSIPREIPWSMDSAEVFSLAANGIAQHRSSHVE